MKLRKRVQSLEKKWRETPCGVCKGTGGLRIIMQWPGEPANLPVETACRSCGRCPPPEQVKVIEVSDVENLGYNPYELLVAKMRIMGRLTDAEFKEMDALEKQYGPVSSL